MLITDPGKISDRITLLGRKECCVYILDGDNDSVMIGGGMAYIIPDVLQQIKEFDISEKKISRLFILHSHFDHCGLVPYFKKRWPWVGITASARAKEILSDPNISKKIAEFNKEAFISNGTEASSLSEDFSFTGIHVEETVQEGDELTIGDLTIQVLEVPGHSSCSIALYVPQEKALFGSDALGVRHTKDYFMASGNSDFNKFQKSLDKMSRYEVDYVLGEHFGASTGEDAKEYLPKSIETAIKTRAVIEEVYGRTRDIQEAADEVTDRVIKEMPAPFMARKIIRIVVEQMVKSIAKEFSPQS
jgi:glyoxylase-like metal-dependent hydrolase (beta-lactamase superfamily II)